jgi:hypothetical protein
MTFPQPWRGIGTFTREGKTAAALAGYQTIPREPPPAGGPQIVHICKSNDDETRIPRISLIPARSVERRYRATGVLRQIKELSIWLLEG